VCAAVRTRSDHRPATTEKLFATAAEFDLRLPDPAQTPTRAGLVASQILGLALCRYVLRLPPIAALSRDEVVTRIGPTIERYVTAR
jgi:hypothetical protein